MLIQTVGLSSRHWPEAAAGGRHGGAGGGAEQVREGEKDQDASGRESQVGQNR